MKRTSEEIVVHVTRPLISGIKFRKGLYNLVISCTLEEISCGAVQYSAG